MSKDATIAEIVKNLHTLSLEDSTQVLNFIKTRGSKKKQAPKHVDRDGVELHKGDDVILLTGGVFNRKGEEGAVEKLPRTVGEYITFVRKRESATSSRPTTLRKLGTSVRKINK